MNVQQRPKVIDDSFGGGFPLPHNIEAEQCVLGAILINNEAFAYVNRLIDAEDFFEPINQCIFGICRNLICERKLANPITIKNFLPHDRTILNMTASQYVARLAAEATTVINAPDYAKVIRDLAIRRHIILAAEDCAIAAKTAAVDVPAEAIAEDTIKRISEITSFRGGTGSNEAAPQIRPLTAAEFLQLELPPRQKILAPWVPEKGLVMVYSPRGMGKTLFGMSSAYVIGIGGSFLGFSAFEQAPKNSLCRWRNACADPARASSCDCRRFCATATWG